MHRLVIVGLSSLVITAAGPAQAKTMKWMDAGAAGLPAGAKMAVVSGNPMKEGPFVIRAKFPAGYTVPPHHHPTDETVRVMSGGSLTYGMGDKADAANSGTLDKGYHIVMQSGMNHWVTAAAATEIQVSGQGPFQIVYVDPKDDPRSK